MAEVATAEIQKVRELLTPDPISDQERVLLRIDALSEQLDQLTVTVENIDESITERLSDILEIVQSLEDRVE
jgi:cell division FtsZ-interacting protein ZapD